MAGLKCKQAENEGQKTDKIRIVALRQRHKASPCMPSVLAKGSDHPALFQCRLQREAHVSASEATDCEGANDLQVQTVFERRDRGKT